MKQLLIAMLSMHGTAHIQHIHDAHTRMITGVVLLFCILFSALFRSNCRIFWFFSFKIALTPNFKCQFDIDRLKYL